jgi:hypothetical protein
MNNLQALIGHLSLPPDEKAALRDALGLGLGGSTTLTPSAVATAIETAPSADLARIQAAVSGAAYLAATIGGMTAAQTSTARLPVVAFGLRGQGLGLTLGEVTIRVSTAPVSLEYSMDHDGFAVHLSSLFGPTPATDYAYNVPYTSGVYQPVHLGLNIQTVGARQECTIYDLTRSKTYLCTLIIGPGYANNRLRVELI